MKCKNFSVFVLLFSFYQLIECSHQLPVPSRLPAIEDQFNINLKKLGGDRNAREDSGLPLKVRYVTTCGEASELETQVNQQILYEDVLQFTSDFNLERCNSDKPLWKQTIKLKYTDQGIMAEVNTMSDWKRNKTAEELPVTSLLPDIEDQLVNINYWKSIVGLYDLHNPVPLKVRYFTKCGETPEVESQVKQQIEYGEVVQFTSDFNLERCISDKPLWKQTIKLKSMYEAIMVEIHALSDCNCYKSAEEDETLLSQETCRGDFSSKICNGEGTCKNGACSCSGPFFGRYCQQTMEKVLEDLCKMNGDSQLCTGHGQCRDGSKCICSSGFSRQHCETIMKLDDHCKFHGSTQLCSGQGNCTAGICQCYRREKPNEVISGRHCECTNFTCTRSNGIICGNNGRCECNQCVCDPGWSGEACDCSMITQACQNPRTGDICSLNGECKCGECKCREIWSGEWCQRSLTGKNLYTYVHR